MSLLSIKGLQVKYENYTALENVNFEVEENEFIAILGPNGGGKTTLIKTLLGIIKPNQGTINVAPNKIVGYVPQLTTFDRNFPITVNDVILIGHLPKRITLFKRYNKHEYDHANSVMERLGILNIKNKQIGTLSGGQLQKVLIARALMNHPNILVLDEPTAGVDEASKQEIYRMLKELNRNMTIIMITHDTNDMIDYFDRIIYINKTSHIHNYKKKVYPDPNNTCPINWFVRGEQIQKQLLDRQGENNDTSNLKL